MFSLQRCARLSVLPSSLVLVLAAAAAGASAPGMYAQAPHAGARSLQAVPQRDRVSASASFASRVQMHGHLPGWVRPEHQITRAVDLRQRLDVTLTLQRDPAVQAAFEKLLADQQDASSPRYHQWLTPEQIGEQYGPTQNDVAAVSRWLGSEGLSVRSVTPSRMQVQASGSIASVGNAFRTSFAYFQTNETQRLSAISEPFLPAAVAPVILSISGLSEVMTEPQHHMSPVPVSPASHGRPAASNLRSGSATSLLRSGDDDVSPLYSSGTTHYVFASDFAKIYDLPTGNTGATIGSAAQHIAIIGRSRVTTNDASGNASINGFGSYTLNQIVVPAANGGSDPGTTSAGDRSEATLDIARTLTSANGAITDLVVSATTNGTDGVYLATAYQVNYVRDPIMSISFGACEANAGSSSVSTYDTLFSQAAAQGTTVIVSSGDSAAAGCDAAFTAPPATQVKSPNFLCSSSYATCVGGTEFNDTASPTTYWSTTNSSTYGSAISYIPEGAWNEPGSAGAYVVTGTGGGVSSFITKPTWQTGTGVPADGFRDTPDVAFTAANHDGYFICYTSTSPTSCSGYIFSGTSAAAPSMAAIAALLNTQTGVAQGNLNPTLYHVAAAAPAAFHDATPASSGVTSCSTGTPSMCNNSTPGSASSLTGGLAGYALTTGYDQATGLGSLDVTQFINAVTAETVHIDVVSPTVRTGATAYITAHVTYTGANPPMGAVTFLVNGSSANLSGQTCVSKQAGTSARRLSCNITYSAVGVSPANFSLTVTQAGDATYLPALGTGFVTVTP